MGDFFANYFSGAASFTIYSRTKEYCAERNILCRPHILDAAVTGGISGAMSGSLISFGSARKSHLLTLAPHHLLTSLLSNSIRAREGYFYPSAVNLKYPSMKSSLSYPLSCRFEDSWSIVLLQLKGFLWCDRLGRRKLLGKFSGRMVWEGCILASSFTSVRFSPEFGSRRHLSGVVADSIV